MNKIYNTLGLDSVINADGRMTALGVSTISDEVAAVMKLAAQDYVVMDDLYEKVGFEIAKLVGGVDACPTASASAGISLTVASLICGNDLGKVKTLYKVLNETKKREVIIPRGHNVDYGAPIDLIISLGGGIVKEVGFANGCSSVDVKQAINENTLALFFVKSHHCVQKNMLTPKEMIDIAKEYKIPIIIDASAEEDLEIYASLGADFVCYSGSKAISGCTSGFVVCNSKENADAIRLQYKGIGRAMKAGKENVMGLLEAVTIYQANGGYKSVVTKEDLEVFNEKINEIDGLDASIIKDEAGREIYRSKIIIDEKVYGISASELNNLLKKQNPKIYLRDHQAKTGSLAIDPRPLVSKDNLETIYQAFRCFKK